MSKARGLADLGNVYNDGALSNRNLIINGAMQVAQRGTVGTHPALGTSKYPSVDRWKFNVDSGGSVLSVDQSTDVPNGFAKSLYLSPDTTATMTGSRRVIFEQSIEGQNLAAWGYGTTDAQPLTLSFWVKSNLTGNVGLTLKTAELCGQTYSIDVADTWEYKTVTFPANAAGTPLTYDNTVGALLSMFVSSSSIFTGTYAGDGVWTAITNSSLTDGTGFNIYSSISNYLNITGVQLEVGDTATPFEHRSYGQELALCQRYYETTYPNGAAVGSVNDGPIHFRALPSGNADYRHFSYKVEKRASPTMIAYNGITGASGSWRGSGGSDRTVTLTSYGTSGFRAQGWTLGDYVQNGHFTADAEL